MISGIYKIANKVTGDFYVGSSTNLKYRLNEHASDLRKNIHCNSYLQRVYNKYGSDSLLFVIVEHVENKNKLIEIEQFYINNLNPKYNICKIAGSSLGKKHSKKSKKKMSDLQKDKPYRAKPYKIISPTDQVIEGINLKKFCRENDLSQGHMCEVLNSKRRSHKGYKAKIT